MKNFCLKLFLTILTLLYTCGLGHAVQFDVLALPTGLFNICDNYFCYPEASEIATTYVIQNLDEYGTINVKRLSEVRSTLEFKPELKHATLKMLEEYKNNDKVDFDTLSLLAKEFGVKSIILISTYTTTDKNPVKRNIWEILEIASAFKTSYQYNLVTNAVLTDNVNNVIMWSSKFNKQVANSEGHFYAQNQAQAASQLEKIKQYYKNVVSNNISQNIYLRFFPQDVRTFKVKKTNSEEDTSPKFVPNALEHLAKPQIIRELDEGVSNTLDPSEDMMFTF